VRGVQGTGPIGESGARPPEVSSRLEGTTPSALEGADDAVLAGQGDALAGGGDGVAAERAGPGVHHQWVRSTVP
jgi:hypothetical protein